jgi:hypothetical protein
MAATPKTAATTTAAQVPARKSTARGATAAKTATPWGAATVVERCSLAQRVGDKRFGSVVELLESEGGERLVRFAYTTGGAVRRGPVTLRLRDLERLLDALPTHAPALAAAFGFEPAGADPGGAQGRGGDA